MKLVFKGPVLIAGGSSALGMALARALREEGARTLSVCRSAEGLARCAEAGLCGLPLGEPESLPERCRERLGEPPAHFADLMHSRFESLIAAASPEAIMGWAAEDIGLRARLARAVGRAMLARRFGRCVFVSSSAAECPAEGQGYYAAAKLAGEALYRSLAVELAGRGVTACSLRLSWLDAGRGAAFLERRKEAALRRMPAGRLVGMDEAVETLLFLLSASASSVNGTAVTLDGGLGATKGILINNLNT